jgi:spore maturation protein SpmA
MNVVFFVIVLAAFLVLGYRQIVWVADKPDAVAPMQVLGLGMVDTAEGAVTLAIGLVGIMALFLGLMKVAEAGGLLTIIAKTIRPLMVRAFPDVPATHPAMGAMVLNLSANVLGLGNAATPFGIRAMQELDKLNPHKGTATNAMVLFLAINTSSVTLLPTGVIALRAAAGSMEPAAILPTTLFATLLSTTIAIAAAKLYQRFSVVPATAAEYGGTAERAAPLEASSGSEIATESGADAVTEIGGEAASDSYPAYVSALAICTLAALIPVTVVYGRIIAPWIIPSLMVLLLGFGMARRVRIYEVFVEGARDGFEVAVRITSPIWWPSWWRWGCCARAACWR